MADCDSVAIAGTDSSEFSVRLESANSPSAGTVEATVVAENTITSGDGEWWSGEIFLTLDGNNIFSNGYEVRAGETKRWTWTVDGLSGGTSELCADFNTINWA